MMKLLAIKVAGASRQPSRFLPPANNTRILFIERAGESSASKWMERANEFPKFLSEPAEFHGGAPALLVSKIYGEFYRPDNVSHLAIEGLLLELTAEVSRRRVRLPERKPSRWLENAKELIHEHFAKHLTLELIARQVGVHPVHLVREFRKHFQLTVGEYIRQRRIEYACRQLSELDIPLIEIALNAGFSQQSHFSKIFKAVTGMTPTEYRRNAHRTLI